MQPSHRHRKGKKKESIPTQLCMKKHISSYIEANREAIGPRKDQTKLYVRILPLNKRILKNQYKGEETQQKPSCSKLKLTAIKKLIKRSCFLLLSGLKVRDPFTPPHSTQNKFSIKFTYSRSIPKIPSLYYQAFPHPSRILKMNVRSHLCYEFMNLSLSSYGTQYPPACMFDKVNVALQSLVIILEHLLA